MSPFLALPFSFWNSRAVWVCVSLFAGRVPVVKPLRAAAAPFPAPLPLPEHPWHSLQPPPSSGFSRFSKPQLVPAGLRAEPVSALGTQRNASFLPGLELGIASGDLGHLPGRWCRHQESEFHGWLAAEILLLSGVNNKKISGTYIEMSQALIVCSEAPGITKQGQVGAAFSLSCKRGVISPRFWL